MQLIDFSFKTLFLFISSHKSCNYYSLLYQWQLPHSGHLTEKKDKISSILLLLLPVLNLQKTHKSKETKYSPRTANKGYSCGLLQRDLTYIFENLKRMRQEQRKCQSLGMQSANTYTDAEIPAQKWPCSVVGPEVHIILQVSRLAWSIVFSRIPAPF